MELKEELLQFCWNHVDERMETLKKRSSALQDSLTSETKSSAGDKHETGRAMVQLEQEKLGQQLVAIEKTKKVLQQVDVQIKSEKVRLGSLVKTSSANYFIAISAGSFAAQSLSVFCVSAHTPIAKLLLGKEKGDIVTFNGKDISILEVV